MLAAVLATLAYTDVVYDVVSTNLNTILIVGAIVGYGVKTILEMTGKTRSSKLLRDENKDLRERNSTLEDQKSELTLQVAEGKANELKLLARIEALEMKVRELEGRDQGAVLAALSDHEVRAQLRAENGEANATRRHDQHIQYLERIVVALESPDFQSHIRR